MIQFKQVTKLYSKDVFALNNVSVEIKDGEFVFLIGPSGAGKTTLLRLLLKDIYPTQGDIYLDDWHINTIPNKNIHLLRRKVGMVFQDFKLLWDSTIFENVAISLQILGKKKSEINKDVNDILELVGLITKKDLFPQQLSAGELQRASIARAIVSGPKVLLADEPTGNLDPVTAGDILKILTEINKIGTTIIMATHNVNIVNEMKKRTITLVNGIVVKDEVIGKYYEGTKDVKHELNISKHNDHLKHTKK
jgi:cell division transport system ATP-binding protein